MADAAGLYLRLLGAHMRSQLQYRTSLALELVGMFALAFVDFAAVLIVFHNVPQLAGWSVREVAFLYAISKISFGFAELAVGHLDRFPELLRTGAFDLLLIRPRGTLFQVLSSNFELRRLGIGLQGLVVLGYALAGLHVHWTAGRLAMLVTMPIAGAAVFSAVWVAAICIAFWTVEGKETANAFTYGGQFFTEYPIGLYEPWLRRLLGFAIPMAFVSYFPALYVLGKDDGLGLPAWLHFASPLVAVVAACVAGLVWRVAVRHYRSAGG